jgi:hypothetical protein
MTEPPTQTKELNLVALLTFIVGLGLALLDLYVVDISSTPDSPLIGLLLSLLPALTAILWVYPAVSWFYARGVKWPSEINAVRSEIQGARIEIKQLSEQIAKLHQQLDR